LIQVLKFGQVDLQDLKESVARMYSVVILLVGQNIQIDFRFF